VQPSISTTPLWQDGVAVRLEDTPLPASVDVLIVGAGYTGLSAARETAKAGHSTLVLDAGALGAGCSGRNGGQVAHSIKPAFTRLRAVHGEARAHAICREGFAAMEHLRALALEERLEFDWRQQGCFYGAHTARHFTHMVHEAAHQPSGLEQRISIVPRAEQHAEIASDFYHGGCVYEDDASVQPMRLLLALLARARDAGALVQQRCAVEDVQRVKQGFEVRTARGRVAARRVLIATNGYTGPLSPWHRRRVIPIGSYQIATEPLGTERVRSLIPRARNIVDTRRIVVYFRPSVDGERIVFGGRAALAERDPIACVPRLRAMLARILPALRSVHITHAWVGWVAYTFDTMPHLGHHDGLYFCMGYCGQGVPTAPYFGRRIGQQMAGLAEGRTPLDGLAFPTRPYYFGTPWFLAPSVWLYRTLDAVGF
jgi:glycine/D-amino acid oxidase-like deaminating enzyme